MTTRIRTDSPSVFHLDPASYRRRRWVVIAIRSTLRSRVLRRSAAVQLAVFHWQIAGAAARHVVVVGGGVVAAGVVGHCVDRFRN